MKKPFDFIPIGKCLDRYCYNGHALLTLGCIPGFTKIGYGDIRDRTKKDGTHWIQPRMKLFLNTKLEESNELIEKDFSVYNRKMIRNQFINKGKRI